MKLWLVMVCCLVLNHPRPLECLGVGRRFPVRPSEEENLVARLKIEVWRTKKRTTPNQ
jgi:hypothetical protein